MAGLLAAAALVVFLAAEDSGPLARGAPAPDFSLPLLGEGGELSLEELRGRVVLVNFWATWCKPCEDEMPAMERLYRRFAADGFVLLAVSVDEDAEAVQRFRDRLGLSFPILLDPEREVSRAYQTFRFPESLLVSRDGVVLERYVGEKDWDGPAYVERIRRLLATGVPSAAS